MDRRVITGSIDTVFEFDYSVQAEDMRSLYEKAKRDQWNAARDIAWSTPETDDGRVLKYEFRYRQKRTKLAAGTRCSRCGRILTTDEELDLTFLQSGEQGPPLCTDCRAAS